jgi:ubiquinone/menaquinone biosynthesis C-methylase UbiE
LENFVYEVEAQVEQHHWWFTGRRKLFARIIQQLGIPTAAPTLDVGTSVGTNLRMLRDSGFSDVVGLDFSDEAARWCAEKGLGTVRKGDITAMPFEDESFSLVLATDIIEHVDDDRRALSEIRRVLKPGGHVLITVPGYALSTALSNSLKVDAEKFSSIAAARYEAGVTTLNGGFGAVTAPRAAKQMSPADLQANRCG